MHTGRQLGGSNKSTMKLPKGGQQAEVVLLDRRRTGASKPLIFEFVDPSNVDSICQSIGQPVAKWTHIKSAEHSFASLWQFVRTGYAFLMIAHDCEKVQSAAFWRLETWANGVCFRCLASVGDEDDAAKWVHPFIHLAREQAKAAGANQIVWEAHGKIGDAMPDGSWAIRQTFAVEV